METRRRREQRPSRSRNGNPPAVVAEHAVLDVIADLNASDKIEDLVTRACQQGATSYDRIERALASRARYRHRTMVSELLVDIRGGATSILEMRGVRRVLRAHGLPEGRGQVREYQNGKVVFRDREIEPYGLVLEFDGRRGHDDAAGRFRDMERDNHVTSTGRRTLRIGWRAVNELECETARSIADVLWNLGWRGQLTRCGTGCRAVG